MFGHVQRPGRSPGLGAGVRWRQEFSICAAAVWSWGWWLAGCTPQPGRAALGSWDDEFMYFTSISRYQSKCSLQELIAFKEMSVILGAHDLVLFKKYFFLFESQI